MGAGIIASVMEIRRDDDNELCGYVVERDGAFEAQTVFGGLLGSHRSLQEAARAVAADGLRSLAAHWLLGAEGEEEELVCIQSASPGSVTVAIGYYSMPGVPTVTVTRDDLVSGRRTLRPAD